MTQHESVAVRNIGLFILIGYLVWMLDSPWPVGLILATVTVSGKDK